MRRRYCVVCAVQTLHGAIGSGVHLATESLHITGSPKITGSLDDRGATAAHEEAVAALLRVRDAAGQIFSAICQAQPLAPHHLLALRVIGDGASTVSEIAESTGRHVSSVSRVVDQMVAAGLVERASDPCDRRQVRLSRTPHGAALARRFERLDRSFAAHMLRDLDADDAGRLAGYLDRIAAAAAALAGDLEADASLLDRMG